jgi:hypothetical protein
VNFRLCIVLGLVLTPGLVWSQDRDFLTANEVQQVREAQDPNDRMLLYLKLARQRLDLAAQYLTKEKPGRSIFVHNALEDYGKIIDAIDSVADDALRRQVDVNKAMVAVAEAEKGFLEKLNKIEEGNPKDLDRYKFVLDDAIDTTRDSQELSAEDANKRKTELSAHDAEEKKTREAAMPEKELKDRRKSTETEDEKKKVPSLLKPGEKPPNL